ncbi:MAG: dethiobiotin synthase [Solirubrobacteraceae bacterium]
MRGCFVTGTDTGVGKTVLTAAIVASLRGGGVAVRVLKPVITGLDEPPDGIWPHDHELLARIAGCMPEEVVLSSYGPPVSPHLAWELAGRGMALPELVAGIRARAAGDEVLVIEGVGGLLVPLDHESRVRDLALAVGLPLLVAARPGLGTINHTLLTLEAARSVGLELAGVVLTPWPTDPGTIERSNLETIGRIGEVEVGTLATVRELTPELLAAAAAALPLERWLR